MMLRELARRLGMGRGGYIYSPNGEGGSWGFLGEGSRLGTPKQTNSL